MTKPMPALEKMPHWPRWLNQQQAAAYLGMSVGPFASEQRAGVWPGPRRVRDGQHKLWDRWLLDIYSSRLSNISTETIEEDIADGRDPGYINRRVDEIYGAQ